MKAEMCFYLCFAEILDYYLLDKPIDAAVDRDLIARQTQGAVT